MGLSIKNDEVENLARELARLRGTSITEAIRQSLEQEINRQGRGGAARGERLQRILAIADQAASLPRISELSDDEILGYDETGVPAR